jgi:hypothetical protein
VIHLPAYLDGRTAVPFRMLAKSGNSSALISVKFLSLCFVEKTRWMITLDSD